MSAEQPLSCPLCSESQAPAALEAHLRFELALPLLRCMLCRQHFADCRSALEHFQGEAAEHPGLAPQLMSPPSDPAKSARLSELLRLARGGPQTIQQRLCVCGHCRLLCREDFRPTSGRYESQRPTYTHETAQRPAVTRQEAQEQRYAYPAEQSGSRALCREEPSFAYQGEASLREEAAYPQDSRAQDTFYGAPSEPHQADFRSTAGPDESSTADFRATADPDEPPAPVDVKPNLADLKPQLASDGRVSCLQCGKRVERNNFSNHAQDNHMPGNPFQCLLCPASAKKRGHLAAHQRKEHKVELSNETYTGSVDKALVREWIGLCFGEAKNAAYRGSRCRPCDRQIRSQDLKPHIAKMHLKKPLHKCLECGFESEEYGVGRMQLHLKSVHKARASADTVDSAGLDKYRDIIAAMVTQLFDA